MQIFQLMLLLVYFADFAKKLGFPDLSKLKELFNFNMNDLTVRKILDLLDKVGLSTLKNAIIKLLNGVEVCVIVLITF